MKLITLTTTILPANGRTTIRIAEKKKHLDILTGISSIVLSLIQIYKKKKRNCKLIIRKKELCINFGFFFFRFFFFD